ncbi:GGDEF domain-containing protein [Roseomonas sp. 18066]|uniref:GGDEF domain-containing protein n=1 Tax=Roseomonas sp. 18066 TaxID=2681412 RepID=UPI001358FA91|nr:GGDEF domain-containing protein [Roseomonas sp. 18066]
MSDDGARPSPPSLLRTLWAPVIRDRRELRRYVVIGTLAALGGAMAVDVLNQLAFFVSWSVAFRSWLVTALVAPALAVPLLGFLARSHLALWQGKQEMERLSRTDFLTGLPNRRALMEAAEQGAVTAMVLVIIDIDRFKRINDSLGHRGGDQVLRIVAQALAGQLADFGLLGRLGGEEFALIATHPDTAPLLARLEALRARLAGQPILVEGRAVSVTISAGAALRQAMSFDELYTAADRALYQAKQGGRNRICCAAPLPAPPAADSSSAA